MTAPSVAAPDTETRTIAVHDLPGQRHPFTVSCGGASLAVIACAALPVARDLVRTGHGLALRPVAAIASVHNVPPLKRGATGG